MPYNTQNVNLNLAVLVHFQQPHGAFLTNYINIGTLLYKGIIKRRRGAARLTRDRWMPVSREFEPYQRPPVVSLSKKLYSNCLVLVGSRNGFESDLHKQITACFTIELK